MLSAFWLSLALPVWYLGAAIAVVAGGSLSVIAQVGLLALAIGAFIAGAERTEMLRWYLLSLGGSQALVMLAGFFRGSLQDSFVVVLPFIIVQAAFLAYLVLRFRAKPFTVLALTVFAGSYASFAQFVAGVALTQQWV